MKLCGQSTDGAVPAGYWENKERHESHFIGPNMRGDSFSSTSKRRSANSSGLRIKNLKKSSEGAYVLKIRGLAWYVPCSPLNSSSSS